MVGAPSRQPAPAPEYAPFHRPAAMCSPATPAQGSPAQGWGPALAAHASAQTERLAASVRWAYTCTSMLLQSMGSLFGDRLGCCEVHCLCCSLQVPANCSSGVVDMQLRCCSSGVLDHSGTCCQADSVLDGAGACCPARSVDACGVCRGDARVVDVQGVCCSSLVDAAGLCCQVSGAKLQPACCCP